MKLPEGARYHFQMQYGSIGWATGATLGVALGVGTYFDAYVDLCTCAFFVCCITNLRCRALHFTLLAFCRVVFA